MTWDFSHIRGSVGTPTVLWCGRSCWKKKTFNVASNVQISCACGSTTSSILPRVLGRPREETTQHASSKICFSSMKYDDPFKHVANTISIPGCNAHCLCILTWIPFCFEEHLPATCLLHRFDITWRSCVFKCSMIVESTFAARTSHELQSMAEL